MWRYFYKAKRRCLKPFHRYYRVYSLVGETGRVFKVQMDELSSPITALYREIYEIFFERKSKMKNAQDVGSTPRCSLTSYIFWHVGNIWRWCTVLWRYLNSAPWSIEYFSSFTFRFYKSDKYNGIVFPFTLKEFLLRVETKVIFRTCPRPSSFPIHYIDSI